MSNERTMPAGRRGATARGFASALALLTALAGGCAAPSTSRAQLDANLDVRAASPGHHGARAPRTLLMGGERGLEVRQWLVGDDSDVIAQAMAGRGTAAVLTETQRERLRRNGLRLMRVPLEQLDALERDLGGASVNQVGWHGQVLQWQEIIARPLPQQRALAIDGRVRIFEPGRIRLMGRAWIVQMEDGPQLNLHLVPQHYRAGPLTYYKLLGKQADEGAPVTSMSLELLLEEGYAYVLTCEAPPVAWPGVDDDGGEKDVREAGAAAVSAADPAGPDVAMPTTMGQLILKSDHVHAGGRSGRGMIIFVPRISTSPEADFRGLARQIRKPGDGASEQ